MEQVLQAMSSVTRRNPKGFGPAGDCTRPPLLGFLLVAFLKNLRVDIPGSGSTALGNIAGHVDEFALFLARRAGFGRSCKIDGIPAIVALPDGHEFLLLNQGSEDCFSLNTVDFHVFMYLKLNYTKARNQLG